MMRRVLQVFAVLTILSTGRASLAQAQPGYPPSTPDVALSPGSGPPGTNVTVTGSGCAPNAVMTITFESKIVATGRADAAGAYDIVIVVPANAQRGPATVTVTGTGCNQSAIFTVTWRSGQAYTGANVQGLSAAGVGLAVIGAMLVFATRRRRDLRRVRRADVTP
jgi:hypothetical protein